MQSNVTQWVQPFVPERGSCGFTTGGVPTTFGTRKADIDAEDVESRIVVPDAGAGTMSITGGATLSMNGGTPAASINYVVGAEVVAVGDASTEYDTPITYTITGVDYSDAYIVLTPVDPATITQYIDEMLQSELDGMLQSDIDALLQTRS